MPTIWETAMAKANPIVDRVLGDTLQIRRAGEPAYRDVQGFVLEIDPPFASDEVDPLLKRQRIKISKAILDEPRETDRFRHKAFNGATVTPGVNIDTQGGDYWVFDLQEV